MPPREAAGPNAEMIQYWNEVSGPRWVALEARLDEQIVSLGRAAMDAAKIASGEKVIDVGCGCGQTTLELAERVGAPGEVLGIDVSAPMLARARERADGLPQASFALADAQTHAFPPERFDLVYSRFGVMFFAEPEAAFANLCAALRPGGRIAFVCWQRIDRNPWMLLPLQAVAAHVALPPPPEPGAPGPLSLADPDRLRALLATAGLADVALAPHEEVLTVGGRGSLERAIDFVLRIGPAAAALREASDDVRRRAADAVGEALSPHATPEGVRLPAASWIATARRAG